MDDPKEVGAAWDEALAADRPCLLEFVTDPAVPPIPPHATLEQIKSTVTSFVKGDADRWGMLKEGVRSKLAEVIPGTSSDPSP